MFTDRAGHLRGKAAACIGSVFGSLNFLQMLERLPKEPTSIDGCLEVFGKVKTGEAKQGGHESIGFQSAICKQHKKNQ
jgi:hypothetical protein